MAPAPARRAAPHIRDERVPAAIAAVPRTAFVPPERQARGLGQPGAGDRLRPDDLAAAGRRADGRAARRPPRRSRARRRNGSGYHAAILAALGGHVWSVERHAELSAAAAAALRGGGGARRRRSSSATAPDGLPAHEPVRRASTSPPRPPRPTLAPFEAQLGPGGRLVAPVAVRRRRQRLVLSERGPAASSGRRSRRCGFVPLARGLTPGPARQRLRERAPTSAKRSPCSSTRRRTSGAVEDERARGRRPRPWRAPRPRSPGSRPSGARARAASRRDTVVFASRSGSSRRAPSRPQRLGHARDDEPGLRARAAAATVARTASSRRSSSRRRAGRRPEGPSSPTSWRSSARPSREHPLQQHRHAAALDDVAGAPGRGRRRARRALEVLGARERRRAARGRPGWRATRSVGRSSTTVKSIASTHLDALGAHPGGPVRGRCFS